MQKDKKVSDYAPIIDAAHLIDLPSGVHNFNKKEKGNVITNPKARICILTIPYPKNGLANLL